MNNKLYVENLIRHVLTYSLIMQAFFFANKNTHVKI